MNIGFCLRHSVWKSPKMSHLNFGIFILFNIELFHRNHPKWRIWLFQFGHFRPIFVILKLTCLVTLFDRKLQGFRTSPKLTIFGIFNELLYTHSLRSQYVTLSWFSNTVLTKIRLVGCHLWSDIHFKICPIFHIFDFQSDYVILAF